MSADMIELIPRTICGSKNRCIRVEIQYPQVIKTRYEAVDQKTDGGFVIFSEREKIFGLDSSSNFLGLA
jgi:hypothetical protein